MNALELKEKIDSLFPCKCQGDFVDDLNDLFSKFIEIVKKSDDLNQESLSFIEELCKTITEVIKYYYEGRRWLAFEKFTGIMNGTGYNIGLFDSLGKITISKGDYLYRGRLKDNDNIFSIEDMFHIPLDRRGLVKTQRFSSPGFPCLYLGSSIYCCWKELKCKPLGSMIFSAFRARRKFGLFDLRIPGVDDYQVDKIDQTLKRLPLILACSIVVRSPNDVFKPEYIIPQFITDTIIMRNKALIKDKPIIENDNNIWGVIYSSTQIHKDCSYGMRYLENIMLPIVDTNSSKKYCQYLASLFEISKPSCYECDNNHVYRSHNAISTKDMPVDTNIQYENSIMEFIEADLQKIEFEELNYFHIPEGVIELDYLGKPIGVPVYAKCKWIIE